MAAILFRTITSGKLDRRVVLLIIAFLLLAVISLFRTRFADLPLDGFLDFMITAAVGIIAFTVFKYTFVQTAALAPTNDDLVRHVFRYMVLGYQIMVVVALVNFISLYTPLLPSTIKETMDTIFAGKTASRMQYTAAEPAWAARQALFGLPVVALMKGWRSPWTIIMIIMVPLTFSLEGIGVMMIAGTLYLIYLNWHRKLGLLLTFGKWTAGFVGVIILLFSGGKQLFKTQNSYFYNRMSRYADVDVGNVDMSSLVYLDESIFIRVAYPSTAVLMFMDHPIFGVGGGNFRHHFPTYINKYFPRYRDMQFKAVKKRIADKQDQSMNLYARILGEFGLVGLVVIIIFFRRLLIAWRQSVFVNVETRHLITLWLIITFVAMLQFDSLAFINMWLVVALVLSFKDNSQISAEAQISATKL